MAIKKEKVPVREQDPKVRATNFEEVCYGYDMEEAMLESERCLNCKNPRCVAGCPVGINIPAFIQKVKAGEIEEAAKIIAESSSLPAVCGRVCPQESQCEGVCIVGIKNEPVSIGKLERFVADWSRKNKINLAKRDEPNGIKVAVIGSGPAGLACAGDLAKKGYDVTIFEAFHEPGGVLTYGIPEFRLPKDEVVQYEINSIRELGVTIETNVIVGRTITIEELFEEGFKSVFIGSGAGLPSFMGIPGENANGVVSANEFLTRVNLMKAYLSDYDTPIRVGKKVAVVGGGNVAMDAVRTALRLGAQEAHIVYRRGEEELPARVEEVHHAKEEGVIFDTLTNPKEILVDDMGNVRGMLCVKMELGEPDDSGRRRPVEVPNSEFEMEVDAVIMSLGTNPNPLITSTTKGLETNKRQCILVDDNGLTSLEGVYAGGDTVTGAATVISAMGAGKVAAKAMDEYLRDKYLNN
ncbi:MAG: NADPH-dependent glutamate synthase [Peptostreptococcaceae bacterium]|nr:NADPH-dependent glutamate synthase [Peptostreptococcaceae bacterium]